MTEINQRTSTPENQTTNRSKAPFVECKYLGKKSTFGVQTMWQSPKDEKSMYCEISMNCTKMKDVDAVWEITKSNYFLNNKKSEEPLEQLAMACAAPLYPFEFTTNSDGRITSLVNSEKIKARFAAAKNTLQREFGSDISMAYIAEIEFAFAQPQQLKRIVTADAWLSLFFTSITGYYDRDRTKPILVSFPFFGFENPLQFKGKSVLGKPNIDQMTQEINVEAELDSSIAVEGHEILDGRFEIAYDIEIPGHWIKNIDGQATVNTTAGKYQVWIQGYLIPDRETITEQTNETAKKRNWWSIFW